MLALFVLFQFEMAVAEAGKRECSQDIFLRAPISNSDIAPIPKFASSADGTHCKRPESWPEWDELSEEENKSLNLAKVAYPELALGTGTGTGSGSHIV